MPAVDAVPTPPVGLPVHSLLLAAGTALLPRALCGAVPAKNPARIRPLQILRWPLHRPTGAAANWPAATAALPANDAATPAE